jgi:nickel-dependent lactate racemase
MALLRFGSNASVSIDFAEGVVPKEHGMPCGEPQADLVASVTTALENPLEYPSLAQCTTPTDRVVVAIDRATPQIATIVGTAINRLVAAGVAPDGITVLRTRSPHETEATDPCRLIAGALRHHVTEVIHDPKDRRQLAYLAADVDAEPILVNRVLHDADFILPVGCLHSSNASGYFGIHSTLYPVFSDLKTQQRFQTIGSLKEEKGKDEKSLKATLAQLVENVAWHLGLYFTMQIVPGAGEDVLHVIAGETRAVQQQGQALYEAAWSSTVAHRASLVMAAIEGNDEQQTWENLGRAVEAAERLVEHDGAIAVCCELADPPGPGMQRVACEVTHDVALRQISKERPVDAIPAAQIAHALDRHKIFLLSRLDPFMVEDLGMTPIADADGVNRLAQQFPSCILLSNASYASVALHACPHCVKKSSS